MNDQSGKFAQELFKEYKTLEYQLTNQYVQLKNQNPFQEFPELARAIWRAGVLCNVWYYIAHKIFEQRNYEGG